jgi:hypothetical protein
MWVRCGAMGRVPGPARGQGASGQLTPGMGYDEGSARDARVRIVAFFDAHLKH